MASFQIPGMYDFGAAQRGIALQQQGTQALVNQMSNLGAQIADSISINNARREADQLQPLIQAQYQRGFEEIASGNVGSGLGTIYSTSASVMQNPILSRMANDANQAAGYIANSTMKRGMLEQQLENRKDFYDYTLANPRPSASSNDPLRQFEVSMRKQKLVDEFVTSMEEATDPIEFDTARSQLLSFAQEAAQAGMNVELPNIVKYTTPEQRDRVKTLSKEIADIQAKLDKGQTKEGGFTGLHIGGKDLNEKLRGLQGKMNEIYAVTKQVEDRMRAEAGSASPAQTNPYSEPSLPEVDPSMGEEIIPLVPEVQQAPRATQGARQLDKATAQQFLQQAGGDKEKARAMARDAGYSF